MDWSILKWDDNKVSYQHKDTEYMSIEKADDYYTILFRQWEVTQTLHKRTLGNLIQALDKFYDYPDRARWASDTVIISQLQTDHPAWRSFNLMTPEFEVEGSEKDLNRLRTMLHCMLELES